MLEVFLAGFVSMFVIVDPLGTSAVFSALTKRYSDADKRIVAIKAFIIATILLIFFGIAGQFILSQMGITLDAFRIAGGLFLFITAFRMIMGLHDSDSIDSQETCYKDLSNIAVFPLSIPLLAGAGCMTAMVLNMNEAQTFVDQSLIIASMITVQIIALILMLIAGRITTTLGPTGASLVSRLMGILLAALSVQFIADGILSIARTF